MKVILLSDVAKLGRKYEVKEVSSGYAQNFLIPNRLAEPGTVAKLKSVEKLQEKAQGERKMREELLLKNLGALADAKVVVSGKANEQGHLFSGIHESDLAIALRDQAHIDIDEDMIELAEPIKAVGEFDITVRVGDETGVFKLTVDPEKAE